MSPHNAYRIGWHASWEPWWRGWRRPWQCEHDDRTYLGARRAFTRGGAYRRMARAVRRDEAVVQDETQR